MSFEPVKLFEIELFRVENVMLEYWKENEPKLAAYEQLFKAPFIQRMLKSFIQLDGHKKRVFLEPQEGDDVIKDSIVKRVPRLEYVGNSRRTFKVSLNSHAEGI